MSYTTQYMAEFITSCSPEDLSSGVILSVKRCLLDLFGAAVAGYSSPAAMAQRSWACAAFPAGPATVWGDRARSMSTYAAALANSAAASALDIDDGHRAAAGHPGASIIPAALAVAEEVDASGMELIMALALGYEVAIRIAAARDLARQDTLSTGRWCAYGVVAAAARLYEAPADRTAQALAIAGAQSPGLSASGYSRVMGNHVKEGIPWGTLTGLAALSWAGNGFSGPLDILDHEAYFDADGIRKGIGSTFAVESVYFKPYACCRWLHAALDALEEILCENALPVEAIERVEVHTFERCVRFLTHEPDPATLEGAQYSLPFCLAVLALAGRDALLPLEPGWLGRPDIVAMARRIFLHVDPDLNRLFPGRAPARVVVRTAGGTLETTCLSPLGDADNPMDTGRLDEKFDRLASTRSPSWRHRLMAAVKRLPSIGARDLAMRLAG